MGMAGLIVNPVEKASLLLKISPADGASRGRIELG